MPYRRHGMLNLIDNIKVAHVFSAEFDLKVELLIAYNK